MSPPCAKHRDGARWVCLVASELSANYAWRLKPETVAVELERPIEVVYCQGNYVDARLHLILLPRFAPPTSAVEQRGRYS